MSQHEQKASQAAQGRKGVTRRGLLKGAAVVGAAAAVLGSRPMIGALQRGQAEAAPKTNVEWVPTSCLNCPATCPLMVKVQDGRVVHVEGNPRSKVTLGAVCAKANLNIQNLYDPDRIKEPMKRTNPKKGQNEDPKWVPISWDEALTTIAGKLNAIRAKEEPHKLAIFRGRYTISDGDLAGRFAKAFGTPNLITHSALCAEGDKMGQWLANGQFKYSAYELEKANYLLMFGHSMLEAHRPTARLQRMWGVMRQERGKRVKTVVIDPRLNVTASVADEWLPINVATDGALALGIAHVILTEGLWDKKYVGDFEKEGKFATSQAVDEKLFKEVNTKGLVKWWNSVLKDFTPDAAAKETGIKKDVIVRIAREFAGTKPAIAWRARGACAQTNGSYNGYAIFALNALVGSYDTEGGILVQGSIKLGDQPKAPAADAIATKGLAMQKADMKGTKKFPRADVVTNNVADSILTGNPYPIEAVIGWMNNWNHSAPGAKRWTEAMAKVPFAVHVTPFATEFTHMCDIILPTPTMLEKWAYETAPDAGGIPEVRIKQPCVKPMFNTRQTTQIFIDMAKKMGGFVGQNFEGIDTAEGYVKSIINPVKNWDEFKREGLILGSAYKYSDPARQSTPSKKFEFYSEGLKATIDKLKMTDADLEAIYIKAKGDAVYVPHYEQPVWIGDKASFPLVLVSYKQQLNSEGRSANNPWAQEIINPMLQESYNAPAEINPETAAKYGIKDGDTVEVESPVGKLQVKVRVWPGIHPDVLAMAFGQGHWAGGRHAKGFGVNPNDITGVAYDHLSGMAVYFNTRVKVKKV